MGMIGTFARFHLLQLLVLTLSTLAPLTTMPSRDWDVSVCVGGWASASKASAKEVSKALGKVFRYVPISWDGRARSSR